MTTSRKADWARALRELIKTEHGFGWSIREHRGKVQLTRRYEDGNRLAVSLELPWDAFCQTGVVNALGEIRQRIEAHGLGLAKGYGLFRSAPKGGTGRLDWAVVVEQFLESRAGLRDTTLRDLRTRRSRTLVVLEAAPRTRDGRSLMRAYADQRQLLDVASLLRFAVTRAGAPDRWLPPPPEEIEALIGHADRPHQNSVPIKGEQMAALLDAFQDAKKEELRLAVALVGLVGLRPAELGVLRVQEGRLYVGNVKRNARTLKVANPIGGCFPWICLVVKGRVPCGCTFGVWPCQTACSDPLPG